jgi:hypothetical protein
MLALVGPKGLRYAVLGLFISLLSLAFVGCGGSGRNLEGVYHGISGSPITITIKGSKATLHCASVLFPK